MSVMIFLLCWNKRISISLAGLSIITGLMACSGNGSGGGITPPVLRDWEPGVYFSSANYSNLCANPRSGNDPFYGNPVRDRQGRIVDENNWLRSIHSEYYLWFDEVDDLDPGTGISTADYFNLQKTSNLSTTGSGKEKDNFHYPVDAQALADVIRDGAYVGYGAKIIVLSDTPMREAVVAYIEPNSPASANNVARGTRVISVDGEAVSNGDSDIINAGLFPTSVGESHSFVVRDLGGMDRPISMTTELVAGEPVKNAGVIAGTNNVGYILFNAHVATAEQQLIDAITLLSSTSVKDLIVDLRYNSGGLLHYASELGYMIAGDAIQSDPDLPAVFFERLQFSDQPQDQQPTMSYYTSERGINNLPSGDDLPTLNASNVVILTSNATCGASESIINNLRALAGLNVFVVGSTTCGNPYGSYLFANCGKAYIFSVMEGFNAVQMDDTQLSDGIVPENTSVGGSGEIVSGCAVEDDFDNDFNFNQENISVAVDILSDPNNFDPATDCPAPPTPVPSISNNLNLKLIF